MFLSLRWDAKGDVGTKALGHIDHNNKTIFKGILMATFYVAAIKVSLLIGSGLWSATYGIWYLTFVSLGYVLMRMAVFNRLYNHFAKLEGGYIGTTDDILDKKLRRLPSWIVTTIYVISGFLAAVCIWSDRIIEIF